jgi:hypothetical protein
VDGKFEDNSAGVSSNFKDEAYRVTLQRFSHETLMKFTES